MLEPLANESRILKYSVLGIFAAVLVRACSGCHQSAPIVPPYPDADATCVVDQRITVSRLIRTEDGSALVIVCEDDAGAE